MLVEFIWANYSSVLKAVYARHKKMNEPLLENFYIQDKKTRDSMVKTGDHSASQVSVRLRQYF